jgi:hypothetical protein
MSPLLKPSQKCEPVLAGASLQWESVLSFGGREQSAGVMHQLALLLYSTRNRTLALTHKLSSVSPTYRANLKLKTGHTLACAQSDAKSLESKIFCAVLNDRDLWSLSRLWPVKCRGGART